MTAITTHESIEVVCGDTWEINGTIEDEDGVPMSLAGVALSWKLDTVDGATNLLELTTGAGIEVTDVSSGGILITVTKEVSATVAPGIYYDWLRIVLTDNTAYTEWNGVIHVIGNPKGYVAPVII